MVVESDDFITMQLVINAIIRNDFKAWKEVKWDDSDSLKAILVKLGYGRDEIVELLNSDSLKAILVKLGYGRDEIVELLKEF